MVGVLVSRDVEKFERTEDKISPCTRQAGSCETRTKDPLDVVLGFQRD